MTRYLLFDLDRTLWDFDGNAMRVHRLMFDDFGLSTLCHTDFETFHTRYATVNDALWELYRQGGISKELLAVRRFSLTLEAFGLDAASTTTVRLARRMSDYYLAECARQTDLMPGARETLDWFAARGGDYSMSVVTNGFAEAQLPKMRSAGLSGYFDNVFLSEDIGFQKPDRRFFVAVLRRLGVEPEQCLVVGDDYKVDIVGAMAVGIPQVWYNPSHILLRPDAMPPTFEISDLRELCTLPL